MSVIWSGITEQGAIVPVQVDETGRVVAAASTSDEFVKKSGDTMTGPLVLPSDPVEALEASTKQYVDSVITNTMPFAMGTFFWSYGVRQSINIGSVRAKNDGIWEFYFENIPQSTDYVVVQSTNSKLVQTRIVSIEQLYFGIQGSSMQTGDSRDQWGCSFVVWDATGAGDVRIS